MDVVECIKISNQRSDFYINRSVVSIKDLALLWIELSEKGYYKCDKRSCFIDVSKPGINYFPDIHSFKDNRGLL